MVVLLLLSGVAYLLRNVSDYTCFVLGTFVSALAPLLLAIVLLVAPGLVNSDTLYAALVGLVLVFSVGEILWAPRLPKYALDESPDGTTALFLATSTLPMVVAKILATALSYWLVPMYCPTQVGTPCDGVILWCVLAIVAMTTPIGLLFGDRWLRTEEGSKTETVL